MADDIKLLVIAVLLLIFIYVIYKYYKLRVITRDVWGVKKENPNFWETTVSSLPVMINVLYDKESAEEEISDLADLSINKNFYFFSGLEKKAKTSRGENENKNDSIYVELKKINFDKLIKISDLK